MKIENIFYQLISAILGISYLSVLAYILFIFFFVFIIGPISYGIWVPIRLHYTGSVNIDIIDSIIYHPETFSPNIYIPDIPDYYSIKTRVNPDFDYLCDNDLKKNLSPGDTIFVFSSNLLKCGFCLDNMETEFKSKTIFDTLFRYSILYSLLGIAGVVTMFIWFINSCYLCLVQTQEYLMKKSQQNKLTGDLAISSYLNLFTFFSFAVLIGIISLKASFAVEHTHVLVTGLVILISGIFISFSPTLVYNSKKYFQSSHPRIILIKNILTFLFGMYGSYKMMKFLITEDIRTFQNMIDMFLNLIKYII